MAASQTRLCVLFRRGTSLLSRQSKVLSAPTFEGQRKLTTNPEYKTPYPYKTSGFHYWNSLTDFTTSRFNENTRIICVEGPPCVRKTEFAAILADHFKLLHLPAVTDTDILSYKGFDLRRLNEMTDNPKFKVHDFDMFYAEPDPKNMRGIYKTQTWMFVRRYLQYAEALRHLLNTGQGVVLENNVFGDMVYASALDEMGYFPRGGYRSYNEYRMNTLSSLWKPHLVLYLDAPNDVILKRMKEKKPELKNSPVLNDKYLNVLRQKYENTYLPMMSKYCEVLKYDLTNESEFDLLLMDFENEDFMTVPFGEQLKYQDWRKDKEEEFSVYRLGIMNDRNVKHSVSWRPTWENETLFMDGGEFEEYRYFLSRIPELSVDSKFIPKDEPFYQPLEPVKGSYLDPTL